MKAKRREKAPVAVVTGQPGIGGFYITVIWSIINLLHREEHLALLCIMQMP
jgi:hypothetical protein